MATPRDYYADLQLPPTADVNEIKKQFRKLALVWHPDRNPGREEEVNARFQIIQSAHEVLSDPDQKAKYDASRRPTSRHPQASGVRGNPWSNAGANFPPPPRRTAAANARAPPPPPPSGAQRWSSRFAPGQTPTAKQGQSADAEAKKKAASAFERMKKGGASQPSRHSQQEARPTHPVPPPTPARESAQRRAEASFGNRKSGYYPHSTFDEPPVSNKNYATPRPNVVPPQAESVRVPDPLYQFREPSEPSSFTASRHSTPYMSRGGEKTDPFDGVPLSRAKSTREPHFAQTPSASEEDLASRSQPRSSSLPRSTSKESVDSDLRVPNGQDTQRPRTADETSSPPSRKAYPAAPASGYPDARTETATNDPSVYATNFPCSLSSRVPFGYHTPLQPLHRLKYANKSYRSAPSSLFASYASNSPSGDPTTLQQEQQPLQPRVSFERQQSDLLESLIRNMNSLYHSPVRTREEARSLTNRSTQSRPRSIGANPSSCSFNFHVDDHTFARTSGDYPSNRRSSSAENAAAHAANNESPPIWQFHAGGDDNAAAYEEARSSYRSAGQPRHFSPGKQPSESIDTTSRESLANGEGFDASGWNDKFGPQTFAPPNNSVSPSKGVRSNSRKGSKVKPTAGTAAVVVEDTSEEDTYEWQDRHGHGQPAHVGSPQAMDIDSPLSEQPPTRKSPQDAQAPRNIRVEPSRPDWRPGDVDHQPGDPAAPAVNVNSQNVGSEDTEEFLANFKDLKNVAPLNNNQRGAGLKSMNELKDNLPFESKASSEISLDLPKPQVQPLAFPEVPQAPRLPLTFANVSPTVASWQTYLQQFETYMRSWERFNIQVVDHFTTRKVHMARKIDAKGYGFLSSRDMKDITEYYASLEQDIGVRQRWQAACTEHEARVLEFMEFKKKMLSSL